VAKSDSARAAAVSRALRAGGLRPLPSGTPRGREGVSVSASVFGRSSVIVSIDAPGARARLAESVEEILREAGYVVEQSSVREGFDGFVIYNVQKEA
jgi:hypothetical protein